ncbi:MAG: hypothetical protein PHH98_02955 [Candidatus Gracilibacteria bacterium]|nr:hypothetical protein [Candidatus Gracilibacteria bacterium]
MKTIFKSIFNDTTLVYKNLLHWNISKILIFIWSTVLAFIAVIPFAIIFFAYSLISGVPFSDFINSIVNNVFMTSLTGNIIYLIALLSYTISYLFGFLLFIKLYNSYLNGDKLAYFKNAYFDYKLYLRYFLLSLAGILILFIPIFFFVIILFIMVIAFGGLESSTAMVLSQSNNAFSIISLIIFILLLVKLYYLFFRFVFSYFILLENSEEKMGIITILKKSFNITKGYKKFLKTTLIFLVVLTIYAPFAVISTYISGNYTDLNDYAKYLDLKDEDKDYLKSLNPYLYEGLEVKYEGKDLLVIESMQTRYYIYLKLYSIFEFIFIFGVFTMVLNSVYRRVILDGVVEKIEEKKEL